MLGRDNVAALRNISEPAELELQSTYFVEQPKGGSAPNAREREYGMTSHQNRRQTQNHQDNEIEVVNDVEEERAEGNHWTTIAQSDDLEKTRKNELPGPLIAGGANVETR